MYSPVSAYAARTASSLFETNRTQEDQTRSDLSTQGVYSRNPSESVSHSGRQLAAGVPEEGRRQIMECENVLRRYVDSPYGTNARVSKVGPMVAYLQMLIRYGQVEGFRDLYPRLDFLNGVRGCGIVNRKSAVDAVQNLFYYGMADEGKMTSFSANLGHYIEMRGGDVMHSMRKFNPNDFLNADTIGAVCMAARLYGEAGGDVAQLRFDTDPTGALALLEKYLPDDRARYAAGIMMTKPVGYKSCITDGGVCVLCDPAQQTTVQAIDLQVPLPHSPMRKRPLDPEAPEPGGTMSPSVIAKRMRSSNPQLPTGDHPMATSLETVPFRLSGQGLLAGPVRSDSSSYHPGSGYPEDEEESSRGSVSVLSQGFRQTAAMAPHQNPGGGEPSKPGDLDDLLNQFSCDEFPGAFWADRIVASLQNNGIVDPATLPIQRPDPTDAAS